LQHGWLVEPLICCCVDGGVRDVDFINAMRFPDLRDESAASSIGRWDIRE
jgi:hypothetical protein